MQQCKTMQCILYKGKMQQVLVMVYNEEVNQEKRPKNTLIMVLIMDSRGKFINLKHNVWET